MDVINIDCYREWARSKDNVCESLFVDFFYQDNNRMTSCDLGNCTCLIGFNYHCIDLERWESLIQDLKEQLSNEFVVIGCGVTTLAVETTKTNLVLKLTYSPPIALMSEFFRQYPNEYVGKIYGVFKLGDYYLVLQEKLVSRSYNSSQSYKFQREVSQILYDMGVFIMDDDPFIGLNLMFDVKGKKKLIDFGFMEFDEQRYPHITIESLPEVTSISELPIVSRVA